MTDRLNSDAVQIYNFLNYEFENVKRFCYNRVFKHFSFFKLMQRAQDHRYLVWTTRKEIPLNKLRL